MEQEAAAPERKTLITLLTEASATTGVDVTDIISPSKRALFNKARSLFALAAREQGYKLIDIGEALGRSHSAAIAYLNKKPAQRKEQPAMKMSKAQLQKHVLDMNEEDRRELVRTLGETSNKEERDLLGEIFSSLESEPVAATQTAAARREVDTPARATPAKPKNWLEDL